LIDDKCLNPVCRFIAPQTTIYSITLQGKQDGHLRTNRRNMRISRLVISGSPTDGRFWAATEVDR
jgi:hypothetical protein